MKNIIIITAILFTTIPCMADTSYKAVGYWGNDSVGCYQKMCNSYNCYDKPISCFNSGYMSSQVREGIAQTLMFNLGRYPTEQEINEAMKQYYNYNRGKSGTTSTSQKKTTQKITAQKQAVAKAKAEEAKRKAEEEKRLAEEKRKQEEYERTRPNAGFTFPYVMSVSPELIKSYYYVSKMPHDEFDKYPLGELNYYEYTDITPKGKIVKKLTRAFTMDYYKKADATDLKKFQTIEKEYNDIIAKEWRITQSNLLKKSFDLQEKYKNKKLKDVVDKKEVKLLLASNPKDKADLEKMLNFQIGSFIDVRTFEEVNIMDVSREVFIENNIVCVDKHFIKVFDKHLGKKIQGK